MNRLFSVLLCVAVLLPCAAFRVSAISARSAVVISADSGEILYSHNCNERMSMASTTKIMTGLLLCEFGNLDRSITVTEEMVRVEGSSMGLLPGDTVSYRDLLYGLLLASGNDAANTIAISLAGSVEAFAGLMNRRAGEMGLRDTHFVTPSGLDAEEHFTTAYELALIAREAISNDEFLKACSSKSAALNYGNPPYRRTLTNHNRLLKNYDGAIGVKTGFTKKSGRCLVSAAERDGARIIAVTLNDPNDWADHASLLDLGFSKVEKLSITPDLSSAEIECIGAGKLSLTADSLELTVSKGAKLSYEIACPKFVYAPIRSGDAVGEIRYFLDDKLIKTGEITADSAVDAAPKEKNIEAVFRLFKYIISFV